MLDRDVMEAFLQSTIELNKAQRDLAEALKRLDIDYSEAAEEEALEAEDRALIAEIAHQDAADTVAQLEQDAFIREHMNWGRI